MKKNIINLKKLLITTVLIITVLTPVFGINAFFSQNAISGENLKTDLKSLSLASELQSILKSSTQKLDSDKNVFDEDLNKYLEDITFGQILEEKVKIILLFDDTVDKSERINAINSVLDNYEIIANYNIIPGIYLSCDSKELISKADQLNEISSLQKIYKSKIYMLDSAVNQKSSALDSTSYPNWWIPAIGAENLAYDGSGVRVAVIDSGIYDHPDLNLILSQNFVSGENPFEINDTNGHGTHCAGIIGSDGGSSGGEYRGVAPGVSLINARAGDASGYLEEGDIIYAIDWCVDPIVSGGAEADIISMSFGGGYPDPDEPFTKAIESAAQNYGVIMVSSAGNSGPGYFTGGSPASGSYIISVGASDSDNELAFFSSSGPTYSYIGFPDVLAPGVDIISTESPNSVISDEQRHKQEFFDYSGDADYIPLSGTSMACPMVAGALAILKDAYPTINPGTARIALLEGATKLADHNYLKYGAGIINVSKSLEILNQINIQRGNVNNVSKIFPDEIPLKPYDLLHFPGDHQTFNLTLLSGMINTYDINIPSYIEGLSVSLDKSQISPTNVSVGIISLDIKINKDAAPGIRTFELNVTSGSTLYDSVEISINVKLPEYKILMESYHGLNDWFPELSFYQMRFYDAMDYLSELNISIDYGAEYWTPYYNKDTDNSILTEEKLAQYDLIVLQNPILPYNPLEMNNIKNYFDNGGNILFLGTRYQDLCSENLNEFFDHLQLGLQINEENIDYTTWLGIGFQTNTESVANLNSSVIFNGVDKFAWSYGNTFTIAGNIDSIASIGDRTVAAVYDESSPGKGKFVAFGDLHWLTNSFTESTYQQDHINLLINLMGYFFDQEDISIKLALNTHWTSNPQINFSVYVKDQITDLPIASSILNSNLTLTVENNGYLENIVLNSPSNGIALNYTYNLPNPSDKPYVITVNLTLGSEIYSETTKILYYDTNKMPQINLLTMTSPISRDGGPLSITAQLDQSNYDVTAYMSLYSFGVDYYDPFYLFTHPLYNSRKTLNKTLNFNNVPPSTTYTTNYSPTMNDPAGFAVIYLLPKNITSNYYNPFSQRLRSSILNEPPEFDEFNSTFTIASTEITFDESVGYMYQVKQGATINFKIDTYDSVLYEDQDSSNMHVFVNFFICTIAQIGGDSYVLPIFPNVFPLTELTYQSTSNTHQGSYVIPYDISYSTISGTKSISTVTDFNQITYEGYLAVLWITVIDSDGGTNQFIIPLSIQPGPIPFDLIFALIIALIIIVISTIVLIIVLKKKKKSRLKKVSTEAPDEYYQPYTPQEYKPYQPLAYCPYCGFKLGTFRNFCPNCGKPLQFKD
ncbi:MAG: S8 family serine peptidase [Candidatus Hodarchaeota archaeon]